MRHPALNPPWCDDPIPMKKPLPQLKTAMTPFPYSIDIEADLGAAQAVLSEHDFHHLPVTEAGELVGMLTEFDCLKLLTLGNADHEPPKGQVKDFMSTAVQTIPPDMDIYYVAGLFMKVHFRRFPVVEDGQLVGAITRFDIMRAVQRGLVAR